MNSKENTVPNPNPYGPIDEKRLSDFEKKLPKKLPSDYLIYLEKYNGGEFGRSNYFFNENIQPEIHHMLGLHGGPDYLRLDKRFDLKEYYDLDEFSCSLGKFIVFADTATGELFLLNLFDGAVYFFDKSAFDGTKESLDEAIILFEDSFESFSRKLISNEEMETKLKRLGIWDDEFEKRLAEAKRKWE